MVSTFHCIQVSLAGVARGSAPYRESKWLRKSNRFGERHGGFVNQFRGDGIMALFGAPVATEQSPDKACSRPSRCSAGSNPWPRVAGFDSASVAARSWNERSLSGALSIDLPNPEVQHNGRFRGERRIGGTV